ncbi:fibronectin type III domain-containing protein [Dyadobacter pollutisoli]|uniref:Fibronectin type III domain-containing protein n=1 Tax=Dyadobacter pollutisoli TaxID=2910158 RepID=A0A9E8SNG7_9BACT|nr:T9SS type A sorting domain-containing protein [Dyadobacter pollutisoli]WAC13711.1 fibronectin type III domain-containing protein [Dyadobacter pollutisoli]
MRNSFALSALSVLIVIIFTAVLPSGATALVIPKAPQTLAAVAVSPSQITITWVDASLDETGFELESSTDGKVFVKLATPAVNVVIYQNIGLTASTAYWYRIRAKNASGFSVYSNIATATTKPPLVTIPKAPSGLKGSAISISQINLSWEDNATDETGFQLERSLNGTTFTKIADLGANITAFQNTGLATATTYHYRVRALNTAGGSAYSNVSSITTQNIPVPDQPTGFTAVPLAHNLIQLRWSPPTGNAAEVWVERSRGSDAQFVQIHKQAASVIQYEDKEALATDDYYYRIKAVNAGGSSPYSLIAIVRAASIITSTAPAEDGNLIYVSEKSLITELKNNVPATLLVFDLKGAERKKSSIGQSAQTDLNFLPAGIYIVIIRKDNEVISRKIALY